MQDQAIEVAQDAMEKYTIEKDIAQFIKKEVLVTERILRSHQGISASY